MISRIFMPSGGESMKKTYFWTVMAGLLYAGSSFLMSMAVSNILGAHQAGVFTIAMTIGNQLVTIGYYNMRTFQASDVTEKYRFEDYSGFRAVTVAAMAAVGIIWVFFGGYTGEKAAAICLMAGFKICEAVSDLLEGRYQQKGRYDVACRGVFAKTSLYLVSFVLALAVTGELLTALAVMALVYAASILIIDSTLMKSFGGIRIRFSADVIRSLTFNCMPLFINSFFMTYIVNAAKYSMENYYSDDYLGIFNALYMMAFVVNLFSSFVLKPLITPLSVKFSRRDFRGFTRVIKRQLLIIAGITAVCMAGAYILGIPVLTWLFGIDLSGYRRDLCVILAGGAFTAVYQLLQYGIVIMRHQAGCLAGCIVTAALTFVFTPFLVRRYAIFGGAVSYFCSMALMS
ncbi:MAG: lipopolysaccharide biosynthesis protein, partial [Ruminococcus sp.]